MFSALSSASSAALRSTLAVVPIRTFSDIWKRKPNVIFKPFTVSGTDTVFSVTPIKGKFGPKQEYITIIKNGCMLAEVIPCSKDQFSGRTNIEYSKRVNFAMSLSNMGKILAITDEVISSQPIDTKIEYTLQTEAKKKSIHITKKPEDQTLSVKISEIVLIGEEWRENALQAQVPVPDFLVFRELCRYSLPYIIGWQALTSYDFAEKDAQDERI